jgi:pimeloyl-ACP methyl ester carboxylesterase
MRDAVGDRELIALDGLGIRLQGTYHLPADRQSGEPTEPANLDRVGVLFVNSLSMPRAASGDSAVRWAEAIANQGYPAFRIDLPGLGDSEGEASIDLLDIVNAGGFASVAAAAAGQLVKRFGLSGVVFFGHCAGAVSALYAGAASGDCKGLILLDPYFYVPLVERPRVRQRLSDWARSSRVGRRASNLYDRIRNFSSVLRGSALPANANGQLLARWKQVASTGLPILLLKAPGIKAQGSKPRLGEFDYIDHVVNLAGRKKSIAVEFVESADHSFANCEGREAVEQHIAGWLAANFPLPDFKFSTERIGRLGASENRDHSGKSQEAPADRFCAMGGR